MGVGVHWDRYPLGVGVPQRGCHHDGWPLGLGIPQGGCPLGFGFPWGWESPGKGVLVAGCSLRMIILEGGCPSGLGVLWMGVPQDQCPWTECLLGMGIPRGGASLGVGLPSGWVSLRTGVPRDPADSHCLQCSFLPKFSIYIETKYEDNCGDSENVSVHCSRDLANSSLRDSGSVSLTLHPFPRSSTVTKSWVITRSLSWTSPLTRSLSATTAAWRYRGWGQGSSLRPPPCLLSQGGTHDPDLPHPPRTPVSSARPRRVGDRCGRAGASTPSPSCAPTNW